MRDKAIKNSTIEKKGANLQIENHDTAAWANIEDQKPVSMVTVPSEDQIGDAREWVDENEK